MNNSSSSKLFSAKPAEPLQKSAQNRPRFESVSLFGGENEIVIEHHGSEYRLRITSSGKLILTK